MFPRRWQFICFAPDDGGSGGGSDTPADGGGAGGEGGEEKIPAWGQALGNNVAELATIIKTALTTAEERNRRQIAAQQPKEEEEPEDEDPAVLETLSRKDFGEHLIKKTLQAINKQVVEPLNARLEAITATTTKVQLATAIKEEQVRHKDFNEWTDEMLEIHREHPNLPIHRIYTLARSENPDKAKKMDAKYAPKDEGGANGRRMNGFGGLTPGQSGGGGARGRRMSGQEAVEAAWAEVESNLGKIEFDS